jgi:YVTN family beta-propeller protein
MGLTSAFAGGSGYHLTKTVTLGGEGGWDLMAIDPPSRRLFITHSTHVMVVDADSGNIVGDIPDTPGVHAVAIAGNLGRGFVTNGANNSVTIFDLHTLAAIAHVAVGTRPDAILYDEASHRVFSFNAGSNDATAIDAATGAVVGTIALGGKPELAAADGKGVAYINVEDKSEVIAFDTHTLSVRNHWPLAPCDEPSGMAIDRTHARLFIGCHNNMMAVVATDTGRVVATPAIGQGVDSNRFDPATGFAFSSNGGDGTLTVVHEDAPDFYSVVENIATAPRARTMELDPRTHSVYLVTADTVPVAPTADNPHPRPSVVPGTFRLLIFGR